jgi:hypothetical protein
MVLLLPDLGVVWARAGLVPPSIHRLGGSFRSGIVYCDANRETQVALTQTTAAFISGVRVSNHHYFTDDRDGT